jgi:hypothetical protein
MTLRHLAHSFEELPFSSITAIVAGLSVPAALAACYLFRRRMELRWLVALVSPLFIASCLYWFPPLVNGVANNAEYGAWFGVAVMMWGFGGVCASIVVLLTWTFVERARNR